MKTLYIIILLLSTGLLVSCETDTASNFTNTPTGKGGSMARFALGDGYLYAVNDYSVQVFEIESNGALSLKKDIGLGFGIETITTRDTLLFIGSTSAMYIYDIADPTTPTFVSHYEHIISCDPVAVEGNFAYVTLRIGANCRFAGSDALEIIDISNLSSPALVKSYPIATPYGLGIDNKILFVCTGDNGLKIYNVEDSNNIELLKQYSNIHAYDVIPNNGVLIMTGNDGIFQYNYTDLSNIQLLSHLNVL